MTLLEAKDQGPEPYPLAVDLDGTLIRSDSLVEMAVALAFRHPLRFLRVLGVLTKGRAAFKQALAAAAPLDPATLPYDEAALDFVRARQAGGQQVFLVTAADQSLATAVAGHLGGFAGAKGTDPDGNLKGEAKAAWLTRQFPDGFAYVGDSRADVPVFAAARESIIVGASASVARAMSRAGVTSAHSLPRPRASLKDWLGALRLHQWSKNLPMFVPFILAQRFVVPLEDLKMVGGFVAFGCVASATYVFNDLSDLSADRAHPVKRRRALASGKISSLAAMVCATLLGVAGLVAAGLLSFSFLAVALSYVALTTAYSWRLKRELLIDLLVIAGLFMLRVLMGTALGEVPASVWLCSFTMMLFLSMATAKRHSAIMLGLIEGRPLDRGRAYQVGDAPLTSALGIASASTAIVILLLYLQFEAGHQGLYANAKLLYPVALVLGSWMMRIWARAQRGLLLEDPVIFALRDPVSWGHAAAVVLFWMAAVLIGGPKP
jgi:4-hydroxybenzoate polyprenyltransferase/phosphoserine phosphatase